MSTVIDTIGFEPTEDYARSLDEQDPLAWAHDEFSIPRTAGGEPCIYLCGNSLGLQPNAARGYVEAELDDWARLGVEGHFDGTTPWYSYHEVFNETGARLVGANTGEVVMMNGLTVNLHLLMRTFYRPEGARCKILMETPAFPSDIYAVHTHVRTRGLDPDENVLTIGPRPDEHTIRIEDIERALEREGDRIALIMLGGVNYYTGQFFDLARLTEIGHRHGCTVGFDLAHAAGNLPMSLHDWNVDFAAWCSYKYLNAGPGAIGGIFVHERHARDVTLPRYGGWWGNDPATRFRMHLADEFVARPTAEGWQLSNPPILAMAPLRASLELFDRIGMEALRRKSLHLTGYLRFLIEWIGSDAIEIITPRDDDAHGCQLSLLVTDDATDLFEQLRADGVIADFRPPNVIRVAPVPLYNTFHETWRFANLLARRLGA